jgi:hypothetical protein
MRQKTRLSPTTLKLSASRNQEVAVKKISFTFGVLSEPLKQQIPNLKDDGGHLQKDADAISRLSVRGMLTEKETKRARDRLAKHIFKAVL